MVERYKKKDFLSLLEFVKSNIDFDFYITENNSRVIVKDTKSLKSFISQCRDIIITFERGDIVGVICLWKSIGNNICRHYVKLNAIDEKIADRLLTSLLWNSNKQFHVKLKKNSKFYKVFRNKRFEFLGDRGNETLLASSKARKVFNNYNIQDKEFNQEKVFNKE